MSVECAVMPGAPVAPARRRLLMIAAGLTGLAGLAPWRNAIGSTPLVASATNALSLLDRVTWGATVPAARGAPRVDLDQLLAEQLLPVPIVLPAAVRVRMQRMAIHQNSGPELLYSLWREQGKINAAVAGEPRQALREASQRRLGTLQREAAESSLLRMLHSPNQLQEKMTWFWMNHFNIFIRKGYHLRALVPDFEAQAVRPRALGRFEDLLKSTVRHPAMLIYLDNTQNADGQLNENYGRELLELHTIGVNGGYTQADVTAMSRILTGLGVWFRPQPRVGRVAEHRQYVREGMFEFLPERHDASDKTLLGTRIPGGGLEEVDLAIRLLARHPSTARHISLKLATWFVADDPPSALVDTMVRTFLDTEGDISAVLRALFHHSAFRAALSQPDFKDPLRYVLAGVRMLHHDGPPVVDTRPLVQWLTELGQPLYGRDTPDGYPLKRSAWSGSGQLTARFDVTTRIAESHAQLTAARPGPGGRRPPPPSSARAWHETALSDSLSDATRAVLTQARNTQEWNALLLSSPEFMMR